MNVGGLQTGFQAGAPGLNRSARGQARSTSEPVSFSGANGKAKGVVRLLQEGHFKDVADARLRINFQDQIGQANAAASDSNYAAAIAEFETNVEVAFANFLEGFVPTEEQSAAATNLFNTFKSTVSEIANAFLGSGGSDFAALSSDIEAQFEAFIIDLQSALGITPVDIEVPAPDVESVQADVLAEDSFLDDFRAAFADELATLVAALENGAQQLPEISEPNGNGAAYAKFLEILEGLQTPEPAAADPNSTTIEDLLA